MTHSVRSVVHAFVERPRDFITPKVVLGSLGSIGAVFFAFMLLERIRDRDKPYIVDVIDAKYKGPETYKKLKDLLDKATGDISFWGNRCIYVEGYRGGYQIESFWERVNQLAYRENPEFSLEERLIGLSLVERINALDVQANEKLTSKWFWTRGFNSFLEWNPSGARDIGEYHNREYTQYTKEQYQERFGKEPVQSTNPGKAEKKLWNVEEWEIKFL